MALPTNRTDATTSATNHAGDHNNVNAKVNALAPSSVPLLASGYMLTNEVNGASIGSLSMSGPAVTGNNCLVPLLVPKNLTFNGIGCGLNATATATIRMGIYSSSADNFPATKLVEATVALTDTTPVISTISQTLDSGLYWIAFQANTACSLRAIAATSTMAIGWRNYFAGTSPSTVLHLDYSYNTGLPASLSVSDMQVTIWYDSTAAPRPLLQLA